MRHKYKGRKLGSSFAHTKAMKVSLVQSLFLNDRIKTTEARAKEIRGDVDRIITWAKKGDLHSRRLAISHLGNNSDLVREIFEKVNQGMFEGRNGGYTRIMKLGPRKGDGAPMVIMELVNETVVPKGDKKTAKATPAKKKATPAKKADKTDDKGEKEGVLEEIHESMEAAEETFAENVREEGEEQLAEEKAEVAKEDAEAEAKADADEAAEEAAKEQDAEEAEEREAVEEKKADAKKAEEDKEKAEKAEEKAAEEAAVDEADKVEKSEE